MVYLSACARNRNRRVVVIQYGFNDPACLTFRRRYGVDPRAEPFDMSTWRRHLGGYLTTFITELRTELRNRGYGLAVGAPRGDILGPPTDCQQRAPMAALDEARPRRRTHYQPEFVTMPLDVASALADASGNWLCAEPPRRLRTRFARPTTGRQLRTGSQVIARALVCRVSVGRAFAGSGSSAHGSDGARVQFVPIRQPSSSRP